VRSEKLLRVASQGDTADRLLTVASWEALYCTYRDSIIATAPGRLTAVGVQDRLDLGHVPVRPEVAEVVEELVQLERGVAPRIARVGRPGCQVGVEQLGRRAVGQLRGGELELAVGEADRLLQRAWREQRSWGD
jgi:hypothetical protein